MDVGSDSTGFSGHWINLLISVDVDAVIGVIGEGHDLLYDGSVVGVREQFERVLIDGCYPAFDIVRGNDNVTSVEADVRGTIGLVGSQRSVRCRSDKVALPQNTKAIASLGNVEGGTVSIKRRIIGAVFPLADINDALG